MQEKITDRLSFLELNQKIFSSSGLEVTHLVVLTHIITGTKPRKKSFFHETKTVIKAALGLEKCPVRSSGVSRFS